MNAVFHRPGKHRNTAALDRLGCGFWLISRVRKRPRRLVRPRLTRERPFFRGVQSDQALDRIPPQICRCEVLIVAILLSVVLSIRVSELSPADVLLARTYAIVVPIFNRHSSLIVSWQEQQLY